MSEDVGAIAVAYSCTKMWSMSAVIQSVAVGVMCGCQVGGVSGKSHRGSGRSSPVFAYVGSTVIRNADYAWWVVNCTGYVINVALYLFWDAYDTCRLWWIPERVITAMRALLPVGLTRILGADGYAALCRFMVIIESARWDEVPARKL